MPNISPIFNYVKIGTDIIDTNIKQFHDYSIESTPTYSQVRRNMSAYYTRSFAGGNFSYSVNNDGEVTITCDGNHTLPWCYMYVDGLVGESRSQYLIPDAHYHLSGCPAGGSKDTYFMYLGPFNFYQSYDTTNPDPVYCDMGFNDANIDTGEGKDIDLRCTNYYRPCSIGNKLVDGGTPASRYVVTETGLHITNNYSFPFYANLYFVVMPGTALNNFKIPKPKLIKLEEAYYKGDDVLGRPLSFSPITGYSYLEQNGIRIDYDWETDQYHAYGTLDKQGSDEVWLYGTNWTDETAAFVPGHKYAIEPIKIVKTNNPNVMLYWYLYGNSLIEEQDDSWKSSTYPLGQSGWQISEYSRPSSSSRPYIPWPSDKPYVNYWRIYDSTSTGQTIPEETKDSYIFTIQKQKYLSSNDYRVGTSAWQIAFDADVPDGSYIDVYLRAPKIVSLSGPEKSKPEPPPPRPEPAKPAEPDIAWDLGTTFVISPGSYETGLLDNYESLIWNEVYNDVGDFEVYTCVDDDILHICKPGNMITRSDSDKIMIIESVKITTDVESGNHVTVKGRSLESILERRIIWDQTTVSGSVHDAIKKLITDAIIEPKNECRKIDNFVFEDSEDEQVLQYQMDEAQFEGESLLESVKKICDIFHLGFKVNMNSEGKYAFKLYSGTDRSYYQEDRPYVIFSHNFGNLLDSEFITDYYNYKTTMLVMSDVEDDAIKTKRVTIGDGYSGIDRREVSYKSSTSPNKESGGGKYTNEEFARMLNEDGTRQLTEYKVTNQFQGSADIHQMYIYGEDFFLGDVVQIVDEFGNSACSRVSRLVISHDSNGIYSYPEFEIFERGNKLKISTGSMTETDPSINVKFNDSLTTEHFASEYSTEYTPLYDLVGVAYGAVQTKSFSIKSLKRVMFRGKIYEAGTILVTFPFNTFTDIEINEYIDEEENY